ncbi:MAG TPA: SPOR domain-containing protein [Phenylobacterium sp.]|nr:SPOR domain-containing protein [Phenylobacterium sp.]
MSGSSPLAGRGARRVAGRLAGATALVACLAQAGASVAQAGPPKAMIDVFATRTGLPRSWVVSVKPGMVVAIRDREALASRNPADKVRLQGEIVDEEAAERLGYRSMRSVVEINCETRRDRVVEMEVFSVPNLKGVGQLRNVPGGWVQPSEDAYMADVVRTVCRSTPRTTLARQDPPDEAPPPRVAPRPPVAKPPVAVNAPPAAKAPVLTPAIAPAPSVSRSPPAPPVSADAPIVTAVHPRGDPEAATPTPASTFAQAPSAAPASAPAAPVVAPPQAAPRPSSPSPPPSVKPASAGRRPPAGGVSVQVGAVKSPADARRALKGLAALIGPGLEGQVKAVQVGDRTVHRALVTGFVTRADAAAFCSTVIRKGGACFVR